MAEKFSSLVCPITFCLFHDPVSTEDGHTYERDAIIKWIERNGTSPLTRQPITITGLRPNHIVRQFVDEFQKTLKKHDYKYKIGVDIERVQKPFFHTTGKSFFEAKWIGYPNGPPIVLLKLYGARAEKEAAFYESLTRHPNIVYTYGLVEHPQQSSDDSDTYVMLLQEKAPEGSLLDVLEHRLETHPNKPLSDSLLNQIFLSVTDAMIFLSDKGIIHGDLACRNILVFRLDENEPRQTLVKLTDFGISRGNSIYSKIDAVATVIDTVPIRSSPPEVLENIDNNSADVYSEKTDMYAMGVFMWEVYSNAKTPWGTISNLSQVRQKVINGERLSRPTNCKSDRQWELILKCMSQKPDDRPTFVELKKQLTELQIPLRSSSQPNLCQSKSIPKINETPRSSIVIDETNQTDSDKTQQTSVIFEAVNVKNLRDRFQQKIVEQASSIYGSNESLSRKESSRLSPKPLVIKIIPPREELIKLTKWQ